MFKNTGNVLPAGVALEAKRVAGNYIIQPNDNLAVRVFTNKGERITDPNDDFRQVTDNTQSQQGSDGAQSILNNGQAVLQSQPGNQQSNLTQQQSLKNSAFLVQATGYANLPMVGIVKLSGLTLLQADSVLSIAYNTFYKECYVITRQLNRRVLLLGALGGYVVPLENEQMNVIEVLAKYGGANNTAKVNNIRLIRGELQNPEVYLVDLSTIEGMRNSNLVLQPNDIIYVQPVRKVFFESISDLAPVFSFITSIATLILLFSRL